MDHVKKSEIQKTEFISRFFYNLMIVCSFSCSHLTFVTFNFLISKMVELQYISGFRFF